MQCIAVKFRQLQFASELSETDSQKSYLCFPARLPIIQSAFFRAPKVDERAD